MRTTDGTTTLPTNSQASHPPSRGSDQRGLITLEWLLIVGAIAGLAATSVLTVQQVLDDTSEVPVDPRVRVLEADIAAAFIAAEATAQRAAITDPDVANWLDPTQDYASFESRCESDLVVTFGDVVIKAQFKPPTEYREVDHPALVEDPLAFEDPARCTVVDLRAGLGG